VQGEEFCNRLKIAGTGTIDVGVSVVDKRLALEYYNILYGEGDFEMDSTQATATNAARLKGTVNGSATPLNLYETTKMTFSGKTPLVGEKYIHSRAFYGGIGAEVKESFAVTEMDKEETAFFASTDPASKIKDSIKAAELRKSSPVHLVGMETRNSFNGTWATDARWHQIFYRDVKLHEAFSGRFEVEKLLKFHESPVPEQRSSPCDGIDC
jgi:hypothetical protein